MPDRSAPPQCVAIVGNVSSAIWPHYETARQGDEGLTLDRWTQNVVDGIARDYGIDAVYPFDGPPFHPFIRWAKRTGTLFSSPIGLTIHPVYGLWLAFRAALLIDRYDPADYEPKPAEPHPCDDCQDRPCLTSCPVSAFSAEGYDFATCLDHLATPINDCRQGGCLARIACPVGQQHRYQRNHAAFHMHQLLRAHGRAASAD
ncbi:MAG: ferredoxin [Pseudomonadota bacterium]